MRNLESIPRLPWDGAVLLYAPIRGEVLTEGIRRKIREAGGRTLYPRVEGERLGVYEVDSVECDLSDDNRFHVPEPDPDVCPVRSPSEVDLVIVPGAAFDLQGHRIGYGMGFYDRFLPSLREEVPCWGIAYDFQMVRGIETGERDQPLTGVVTDREVYRRGRFEFLSESVDATECFAETIGTILRERLHEPDPDPWVFALTGDLGAGKTRFTKGLAAGLRCREAPVSPTFTLIRTYEGDIPLQHIDLYRLEGPLRDDDAMLFDEVLRSPGAVAVEWADRYLEGLPPDAVLVGFEWLGENRRRIVMNVSVYRQIPLLREIHDRLDAGKMEIRC